MLLTIIIALNENMKNKMNLEARSGDKHTPQMSTPRKHKAAAAQKVAPPHK